MDTNPEPRKGIGCAAWAVLAGVLIILAMMLFPQLSSLHGVSRRANCLSNLKILGLGIAMYADLNQDRLPMDAANPTLAGSLRMMSNTLPSVRILACPTAVSKRIVRPAEDWSSLTAKNISYMYVPNLIWQSNVDLMVALDKTDCVHSNCQWPASGNHGDAGGNILFNDGHVSFYVRLSADLKDKDGVERFLSP